MENDEKDSSRTNATFKTQYSGENSKEFWKAINNLPENKWDEAYSLGCVLQNIEEQILKMINQALEGDTTECPTCQKGIVKERPIDFYKNRTGVCSNCGDIFDLDECKGTGRVPKPKDKCYWELEDEQGGCAKGVVRVPLHCPCKDYEPKDDIEYECPDCLTGLIENNDHFICPECKTMVMK